MTEFGSASEVPDADRAEQLPAVPDDVAPGDGIPDDAPEADAIEQRVSAVPEASTAAQAVGDREADAGDVLEQGTDVPVDDDEIID